MRKVFAQINVSLDGYIEDTGGEIDWHFVDDAFDRFISDTLRSIDAMIFGRVAFEKLAMYWPTAAEDPQASGEDSEQARLMDALPKYVVSDHIGLLEWKNSHIIRGDVAQDVARLKRQPGKDIALFGGANTISTFTTLGLIDEYRFIVNPALVGGGTRLFKGAHARVPLRLLDTRRFNSGVLVLSYVVASSGSADSKGPFVPSEVQVSGE